MFCPKCKSLMRPDQAKGVWVCRACGATRKMDSGKEVVHVSAKAREVAVIEKKVNTLPTAKEECVKCGNQEAFWVLRQTRGADEPETRIFECTKCGYKWREYQ